MFKGLREYQDEKKRTVKVRKLASADISIKKDIPHIQPWKCELYISQISQISQKKKKGKWLHGSSYPTGSKFRASRRQNVKVRSLGISLFSLSESESVDIPNFSVVKMLIWKKKEKEKASQSLYPKAPNPCHSKVKHVRYHHSHLHHHYWSSP